MIVKTRPSCRRIEHIGGEHPHTTSHHSTGRVHLPTRHTANAQAHMTHESAFGGVGSAERYWRRDRASLRCVCCPSARGCAESRLSRSLDPFAVRGRRPRVRGGWRPEAAFGGVRSEERYWRRERASLGCACRPSARGCADIATLPARSTLLPREGAGRV